MYKAILYNAKHDAAVFFETQVWKLYYVKVQFCWKWSSNQTTCITSVYNFNLFSNYYMWLKEMSLYFFGIFIKLLSDIFKVKPFPSFFSFFNNIFFLLAHNLALPALTFETSTLQNQFQFSGELHRRTNKTARQCRLKTEINREREMKRTRSLSDTP